MTTFPVVCTACTANYGPCLTQCQARINQIDACDICTGNLSVSGLLKTPSAQIENLAVSNLSAATLIGTPSIPSASLGTSSYSFAPSTVTLNGQELQPTLTNTPGAVPLNLANGSTILMGLPASNVLSVTFVLSMQCNLGTYYFYFNASATTCTFALSDAGVINSATSGSAATYDVAPNERGVIFKVGTSYWVVFAS